MHSFFKTGHMANKREFEIAFVGLKPGVHEYNYELSKKFFAEKGGTDFSNCEAKVKLLLDKKSSFMLLKFEVSGKADVVCDRCSNNFTKDLWEDFNMMVKLVENPDEMNESEEDPDVFYIAKTESHLDIANWLYEFVILSIPNQLMCSEEEMGGPQCNKEVLEKLKKMTVTGTGSNDVWKGLEKFKVKKAAKQKKLKGN